MESSQEWQFPEIPSTRRLPDLVAETLIRYIQENCDSGDQLPSETQLAKKLGVSRGPLREALHALEIMGFVEKRNGACTNVTSRWDELLNKPISWGLLDRGKTLSEVVEARILMDVPMAELALQRISDEELSAMEEHVLVMEDAKTSSAEKFMHADLKFHLVMAAGSRNAVLSGFANVARSILRQSQLHLLGLHTENQRQFSAAVHRAILEGLRKRDRSLTMDAIRRHSELMQFYLVDHADAKPGVPTLVQPASAEPISSKRP